MHTFLRNNRRWWGAIILLGTIVFVALWTHIAVRSVTVSVLTDSLRVTYRGGDNEWDLGTFSEAAGFGIQPQAVSGKFKPADGAECLITRVSLGPLLVECRTRDQPVAYRVNSDDEITPIRADRVVLSVGDILERASHGRTIALRMRGQALIGSEAPGVDGAVLREGTLSLSARTLVTGSLFTARTSVIDFGETASFTSSEAASILVLINEGPSLRVVASADGDRFELARAGVPRIVRVPWLSILSEDQALQSIVGALTLFSLVSSVYPRRTK